MADYRELESTASAKDYRACSCVTSPSVSFGAYFYQRSMGLLLILVSERRKPICRQQLLQSEQACWHNFQHTRQGVQECLGHRHRQARNSSEVHYPENNLALSPRLLLP